MPEARLARIYFLASISGRPVIANLEHVCKTDVMSTENPTASELLIETNKALKEAIQRHVQAIGAKERSLTFQTIKELRETRSQLTREVKTPGSMVRLGDISGR